MNKINIGITGCMGRMGQQIIKTSQKNKRFAIKSLTENNTLTPSVVLAVNAYTKGAKILRVHDVQETKEAINIFKRAN